MTFDSSTHHWHLYIYDVIDAGTGRVVPEMDEVDYADDRAGFYRYLVRSEDGQYALNEAGDEILRREVPAEIRVIIRPLEDIKDDLDKLSQWVCELETRRREQGARFGLTSGEISVLSDSRGFVAEAYRHTALTDAYDLCGRIDRLLEGAGSGYKPDPLPVPLPSAARPRV